jgi:hypothetical protein
MVSRFRPAGQLQTNLGRSTSVAQSGKRIGSRVCLRSALNYFDTSAIDYLRRMRRLEKRMRLIRLIHTIWFVFAVVVFTVLGLTVTGEILSQLLHPGRDPVPTSTTGSALHLRP